MEGTKYTTKEAVLRRALEIVGKPLGDIDRSGRLKTGKGGIGEVIEEDWFGYRPNSESEPDFPEAGVDLKVTPYVRSGNGVRAKERLVVTIINYLEEWDKTFYESSFWHKCETLLIMSYEHLYGIAKEDYVIDKVFLFSFPDVDLIIIKQDWEIINSKIRAGQAHLISEGDTNYMAACTKGANSGSVRPQPFSDIPAKQRAYSLKSSYMTIVLRTYIFGSGEDEHIIKDYDSHRLREEGFEGYLVDKASEYHGMTQGQLKERFGVGSDAKNLNKILVDRMLDVKGSLDDTSEFEKANITLKTIRVQRNGRVKESMSFPAFRFTEIVEEEWETSRLKETLECSRFMFAIFREGDDGEYSFDRVMLWNMPYEDILEVRNVWERTVAVIREGVELRRDEHGIMRNNLPKQTENRVAHVRPHGRDASDTYPLPDGREMTKQCFWLNNTYIRSVIDG